jgi:hypothetical protein
MIGEEECAPGAFTYDLTTIESYADGEDEHQDTVIPGSQTFHQHLRNFAGMSAERRLAWDPYQFLYETAKRQISEFAVKLGRNPGEKSEKFSMCGYSLPSMKFPFFRISQRLKRWTPCGDLLIETRSGRDLPSWPFDWCTARHPRAMPNACCPWRKREPDSTVRDSQLEQWKAD